MYVDIVIPGCCKVDRNFNFSTPYSLKRLKRWIPLYPFQKNCLDEKRSNSWLYVMNLSFNLLYYFGLLLLRLCKSLCKKFRAVVKWTGISIFQLHIRWKDWKDRYHYTLSKKIVWMKKRSNSWLYVMNLSFTVYLHYFLCLRNLRCIFGLLFQLCLRTTRKRWRLTQNLVWVTRGFWEWQPPLGPCRSRPHYPNRRLRWPQAGLLESALPWTRWGHWQRTSLEARDQPASLMMLRQGSGSRLG